VNTRLECCLNLIFITVEYVQIHVLCLSDLVHVTVYRIYTYTSLQHCCGLFTGKQVNACTDSRAMREVR